MFPESGFYRAILSIARRTDPAPVEIGLTSKEAWTFLSNHGHILLCLASDPTILARELADKVGITERAVHRIISDLVDEGYLEKLKDGRRNRYRIIWGRPLRHTVEQHCTIDELAKMVLGPEAWAAQIKDSG